RIKILDFGLAKLTQAKAKPTAPTLTVSETEFGLVLGTVGYMSPEQARGEVLDARTDLFSLGAVLYEMVTGKAAFHGPTPAVVFNSILAVTPVPPSHLRKNLPLELDRIICKALEKNPGLRYQTAAEIRADLTQLQRLWESGDIK